MVLDREAPEDGDDDADDDDDDDDDDISWISLSPAPVLPTRKFLSELLGRAHLFWNVNDSLTAGEEFYKSGTMLINTDFGTTFKLRDD